MRSNLQAVLRKRPGGFISQDDIEIVETPLPDPAKGEILVDAKYISIDFAMRGWLAEGRSYVPALDLGDVVRGCATGYVTASRHPDFNEGDAVSGMLGVQSRALSNGEGIFKVDTAKAPLERWAGGLGLTTAMTAYLGLLRVGEPNTGETVLVSGASGSVGSIVGQIARIKRCRAVGIAGGLEKCRRIVDDLGFDACMDYREENLLQDLQAVCPRRVDVLFENVGGEIFDTALTWMNTFGRVVLCGMTADRAVTGAPKGIMNIRSVLIERLALHGFILFDHAAGYAQAARDLGDWYADGHLKMMRNEHVREGGIGAFVDALNDVLANRNRGKMIMEV